MTPPFKPVTVPDAGDLDREEAQVASLQRVKPSTYVGRWTAICLVSAAIAEAVFRLAG